MKAQINTSLLRLKTIICALLPGIGIFLAGKAQAQSPTVLVTYLNVYVFSATQNNSTNPPTNPSNLTNYDGTFQQDGLILADGMLYGTASQGGEFGNGTVFAVSTNGTGFTTLHAFTEPDPDPPSYGTNMDGSEPVAALAISGGTLYGTTRIGGAAGDGVVFAINKDGSGFTNLHSFGGNHNTNDGAVPYGRLLVSGNILYGTTSGGGSANYGTVFSMNNDGTGFTILHSFGASFNEASPSCGLVLSGGKLYGTTPGTVFAVNTNGTGFTNLTTSFGSANTLALSGNTLYGASASPIHLIFSINTDGSGLTNLHNFINYDGFSEGINPSALTVSGNSLYGCAQLGGSDYVEPFSEGSGTVFTLNTDGTGFRLMCGGGYPVGQPVIADNTLYVANNGGLSSLSFLTSIPVYQPAGTGNRFFRFTGPAVTSITAFYPDGSIVWSNGQPGATYTVQTTSSLLDGTNWVDYIQLPTTNVMHTNQIVSFNAPAGFAFIPGGSFLMGDSLDGETDAVPVSVTVSSFYLESNLVCGDVWAPVFNWATNNGYAFLTLYQYGGGGRYPEVDTFCEILKWCNARSQMAGLTPVYYADAGFTTLFKSGDNSTPVYPNWSANGYRLPTEAEWEKGARGGLKGQRFPWGNFISGSLANYWSITCTNYLFDLGPDGVNGAPGNVPVGSFSPNGYGLYDMAGNSPEYVWDRYAPVYAGGVDPHGPATGPTILRCSSKFYGEATAWSVRCANRQPHGVFEVLDAVDFQGFRCARTF
jgi:uncharacterized repeat protein (TIGR03803 family)